ncbi:hypothetical protein HanPI659440_Chr12g0479501 [Helianthus annuus]|nr:hypothetical protein HanPI659440_Chr12g0479501 [Helianthus annuus]
MSPVPNYKYPSDYQKRKKRKLEEEKRKADDVKQNRINKFFSKETQNSSSNLGDDNVGEEANVGKDNVTVGEEANVGEDNDTVDEDDVNPVPDIDMIKELVTKGPKRDMDVKGPVDKFGRHFSNTMYTRILSNRETCDREWLVYSKKLDKLFCFCCKVFRTGHPKGGLDDEGYKDWRHASGRLK